MRKLKNWALLLCAASALAIGGCGSSTEKAASTEETAPASEDETKENTTPAEETAPADEDKADEPTAESEASKDTEKAATRTISDSNGNPVEVPEKVESIAAVSWPWPSLVFAVTGDSSPITCMPEGAYESYEECMFKVLAPELADVNTSYIDSEKNINYEELAKVAPDVMLLYESEKEMEEPVKSIGVTPVRVNYGKLLDVQNGIRVLGELFQVEDRAESMIQRHQETIQAVEAKASALPAREEQKKVLYLYAVEGDGTYRIFAGGSLGQDYLNMVGGINVAEDIETSQATVNMEQILAWNPDVILLSNFDDFMPEDFAGGTFENTDWSSVEAVKNQQIYKVPMGLYRWDPPCAESYIMLEWIAQVCNPDIFNEFDVRAEVKEFYQTYFSYDLSEEEIDRILYSQSNQGLNH